MTPDESPLRKALRALRNAGYLLWSVGEFAESQKVTDVADRLLYKVTTQEHAEPATGRLPRDRDDVLPQPDRRHS